MKKYKKFTHTLIPGAYLGDDKSDNEITNAEIELNRKFEKWQVVSGVEIISITPTQVAVNGCLLTSLHVIYQ